MKKKPTEFNFVIFYWKLPSCDVFYLLFIRWSSWMHFHFKLFLFTTIQPQISPGGKETFLSLKWMVINHPSLLVLETLGAKPGNLRVRMRWSSLKRPCRLLPCPSSFFLQTNSSQQMFCKNNWFCLYSNIQFCSLRSWDPTLCLLSFYERLCHFLFCGSYLKA